MSTREIAYHIFEQLTEELERFIAIFGHLHPVQDSQDSDMTERRIVFERLEKMCRPIPDLDEKKNWQNTKKKNMTNKMKQLRIEVFMILFNYNFTGVSIR
ncbi:MAG: hypothetical protein K2O42_01040 [Oscillospiraceae bacterium]|nr:hypothetical protein [Oscillospiraceae bacterium]